jgi:hydrogenase-1 operon protein HyaE
MSGTAFAAPTLAALGQRLTARGFAAIDATGFDAYAGAAPGDAVVLFAEDPGKVPETWDFAVILPEVLKEQTTLRAAFLLPEAARQIQPRYGFRTWPALLFLRDGGYVGVIEGIRDWAELQREVAAMLARPVSRPPTLGIAVRSDAPDSTCH